VLLYITFAFVIRFITSSVSITKIFFVESHVINWNEAKIIARESEKTTRWIRKAVKIRQGSQGVMNRDEGPTS